MSQKFFCARTLFTGLAAALVTLTLGAANADDAKGVPWNPSHSDQWVAVDSLGRELPTFEDVGPTRPGKYVACFYFLWNGRHGDAGPYNISQILKDHPEAKDDPNAPYWGQMYAPHHWGESIFGYYVGEDESVLRKHAQMLGDAGVDVICFDVTNQLTYPESYRPLFKVFSELQSEGVKVPKVAFLCPFWAPDKVVRELWRDVYSKNFYNDVWFYWKGKPLILADPDLIGQSTSLAVKDGRPVELTDSTVAVQRFSIDAPFTSIALSSPTWEKKNSAVNLRLLDANGAVVLEQKNIRVKDNVPYSATLNSPAPAGKYAIELRKAPGESVGWWASPLKGEDYSTEADKARHIKHIKWLGAEIDGKSVDLLFATSATLQNDERSQILNFFTFRPSQPDYFMGQTKPNQWSWLEAYPQHPFYNDKNELEEMCVGVAQNAVEGKLGVLSNPRSYGRSSRGGIEPPPEECNYFGNNFQEQWDRALKEDPEIVFVTGWNEWIAGRFDITAPFHGATPVSFVDQYNEEFSRDCEPMKGGHADAYYYQLIANIRRFKGVSQQDPVNPVSIAIDGKFDDWKKAAPVYYDSATDPVDRDCRGWGKDTRYVNKSGRNDFVEARASFDAERLYFYAKTKGAVKGTLADKNWMNLMLDVDDNPTTGVKGCEYLIKGSEKENALELVKLTTINDVEQIDQSVKPIPLKWELRGDELELSINRSDVSLADADPVFRFKWSDAINVFGDWSEFTTDGDAAPNDRYFYRFNARR